MLAKHPARILLATLMALSPFAIAACDDSKPSSPTTTDPTGVSLDLLKNYPTKENNGLKK